MINAPQQAHVYFSQGYNCAQSVLMACGVPLGLPVETAAKLAQALGGGVGRTGNVCGALVGALMAVGLKCRFPDPKDPDGRNCTRELCHQMISRFRDRHGSILCRDLLGHDLSTEEGARKAHETGAMAGICPGLVRAAAGMLREALEGREGARP